MPPVSTRRAIRAFLLAAGLALGWAGASYGPVVAFHLLPPSVTGEAGRLAELLGAEPGRTIAEIGAGDGSFSVAIARLLQPGGTLYSTELDPDRLGDIRKRVDRERLDNVVVVAAGEASTNLPDECCDAIFMRNVYHHIADTAAFNRSLRRAIRPGGRVAIIDFPPGALSGRDRPGDGGRERNGHGVTAHAVARELEEAGFVSERVDEDWGGRTYLVLLRAPGGSLGNTGGRRERPAFAGSSIRLFVAPSA
jgi:SAM-dependent methyltransferase